MPKKDIKPVTLKIRPVETKTEIDDRGAFQRQANRFTTPFGDEPGQLKAEKGKYRLFWARGCHWSNRASIVRELLGLEDVISVNQVSHTEDPERRKYGWEFSYDEDLKDPETGAEFLAEFYYRADPDYIGRSTVPALVDLNTYTVANNDYHRLTNYFETAFNPFHKEGAPDLYPEDLREDIDNLNDNVLFPFINNGVYRMMFAQSIVAYEEAFDDFFTTLDVLEKRLATNRFLFGDYVTDSDVRLFVTLARFDTHYYRNLGPIKKRISEYESRLSETTLTSMILLVVGIPRKKNSLWISTHVLRMILILMPSGQHLKSVNTFQKHQIKNSWWIKVSKQATL